MKFNTLKDIMEFGKDLVKELDRAGYHDLAGKMRNLVINDFGTEAKRMELYRQGLRVIRREAGKDLGPEWRVGIRRALRQINRARNSLRFRSKKWMYPHLIYTHVKKHACPKCGTILSRVKVSRIVHSGSEEAKEYDFSNGENYMLGNVEFIWDEFLCEGCGMRLTVKEMKEIERG